MLPSSAVKKATQGSVVSPGSAQAVKVPLLLEMTLVLMAVPAKYVADARCLLQEGQTVVYSKYAGTELDLQGTDHVILKVRAMSFLPWWQSQLTKSVLCEHVSRRSAALVYQAGLFHALPCTGTFCKNALLLCDSD